MRLVGEVGGWAAGQSTFSITFYNLIFFFLFFPFFFGGGGGGGRGVFSDLVLVTILLSQATLTKITLQPLPLCIVHTS